MNDDNSVLSFFVGFCIGVLGYREWERYEEEKMIKEQLRDGAPPQFMPEDPAIGSAQPEPKFEQVKCGVCGEPNEIPQGKARFECKACGHVNNA